MTMQNKVETHSGSAVAPEMLEDLEGSPAIEALTAEGLQNSSNTVMAFNQSGQLVFANRSACDFFAFPREVMLRKSADELGLLNEFGWTDLLALLRLKGTVQAKSHARDFLNSSIPVTVIWQLSQRMPETYVFAYMRDISELERVAEDLRERDRIFRTISMAAQDALIIIDTTGLVTFWNPAAERMFGYSAEEAIGQDMHDLIAPIRYHEQMRPAFAAFGQTGHGRLIGHVTEVNANRKDGTEFPAEISISAIRLSTGWHALGIVRDITRRKKGEEALAQAERERQEFYRFLVHDLNKPLAVMVGMANRIKSEPAVTPQVTGYANMIENAATRSRTLVGSLLEYERIRRGELSMDFGNVDLCALVLESARLLQERRAEVPIYFGEVPVTAGHCPHAVHVRGDSNGLHRVVQNLIDNALKFGKARVVLNVAEREDGVLFSSWNDGPPIAEPEAEHIFHEFYRGSNGRKAGGFGLGLASAKTLVQAMRGKIWYESPDQGGSMFCVLLPRSEPLQSVEEHKSHE